ncbi:hypothetical protein BDW71DRAFT_173495 [Aspergillus fruticulosus]
MSGLQSSSYLLYLLLPIVSLRSYRCPELCRLPVEDSVPGLELPIGDLARWRGPKPASSTMDRPTQPASGFFLWPRMNGA